LQAIYFIVILNGARNSGGLPKSMVSSFESRNREASNLPRDALLPAPKALFPGAKSEEQHSCAKSTPRGRIHAGGGGNPSIDGGDQIK
jgi:hypothetical protein